MHEFALRNQLGSVEVMEDQYLRLLFNTHVFRIVPASARTWLQRSKFTLYEFKKAESVAYAETEIAQVFAQDNGAVSRVTRLFGRLDEVALDPEQSRCKLMELISEPREDSDGSGTALRCR